MRLLESAGRESGVGLILLTDKTKIAEVADYVVQGNTAQMHDAAFMTELKSWLRFSETDAVATRDGLLSRASGNPTMPSWLARAILPLVFTADGENRKYRDHVESSAGSPYSRRMRMTSYIGWPPGAPASASRCRRPRSA